MGSGEDKSEGAECSSHCSASAGHRALDGDAIGRSARACGIEASPPHHHTHVISKRGHLLLLHDGDLARRGAEVVVFGQQVDRPLVGIIAGHDGKRHDLVSAVHLVAVALHGQDLRDVQLQVRHLRGDLHGQGHLDVRVSEALAQAASHEDHRAIFEGGQAQLLHGHEVRRAIFELLAFRDLQQCGQQQELSGKVVSPTRGSDGCAEAVEYRFDDRPAPEDSAPRMHGRPGQSNVATSLRLHALERIVTSSRALQQRAGIVAVCFYTAGVIGFQRLCLQHVEKLEGE